VVTDFPRTYLVPTVGKHVHPLRPASLRSFCILPPAARVKPWASRISREISTMDKLKNGEFPENILATTCSPSILCSRSCLCLCISSMSSKIPMEHRGYRMICNSEGLMCARAISNRSFFIN